MRVCDWDRISGIAQNPKVQGPTQQLRKIGQAVGHPHA